MYKLYDGYEFEKELLGKFDNLTSVKKCCKERDKDTDGEWLPMLYKFYKTTGRYELFENWSY